MNRICYRVTSSNNQLVAASSPFKTKLSHKEHVVLHYQSKHIAEDSNPVVPRSCQRGYLEVL